jgi:hypothetical protein
MNTQYIHIYKVHARFSEPMSMTHAKEPICKRTAKMYYFGEGQRIARDKLNTVVLPECDTIYMLTPDNELARQLFTEWFDRQIQDLEYGIERFKEIKQVVSEFKD